MLGRWPASPFDRMIAWPTRYRPFYSGVRARFPKGHTPLQHFYRTTRPTSLFRSVRLQRCSWLFHVNIQYSCASLDCVLRAAYIHYPGRIACPCVGFRPHDCCSTTAVLIPCDRFCEMYRSTNHNSYTHTLVFRISQYIWPSNIVFFTYFYFYFYPPADG